MDGRTQFTETTQTDGPTIGQRERVHSGVAKLPLLSLSLAQLSRDSHIVMGLQLEMGMEKEKRHHSELSEKLPPYTDRR